MLTMAQKSGMLRLSFHTGEISVYFERGDLNSAIHWQQMAVEKAGDDPMGASIRKTLEEYEGARKKK